METRGAKLSNAVVNIALSIPTNLGRIHPANFTPLIVCHVICGYSKVSAALGDTRNRNSQSQQ